MNAVRAWLPAILAASLVAVVAIPLIADEVSSACMPWDDRMEAHLSIDRVEAQDGEVSVSGTSDLPDDAVFGYFFLHEDELGDVTRVPRFQAGGETRVHDGQYSFAEDLSAWPDGDAVFDVWFQLGHDSPQPDHLVERFGTRGQCLTGPQVGVDSPGDPNVLRAGGSVTLPTSVHQ